MKVPFVDLPRQMAPYNEEIRSVLEDVMFRRADFIMRQDLLDFEAAFAVYLGCRYAIGVANGSDALNMAVKVLGIGQGDEVITVSHTFVATIAAIVHAGASPILVDVGDDHVMDMAAVEAAVTRKTKAVIPVHLNGRMCDMETLGRIAGKHGLRVIEDSAQGIGASLSGRRAGMIGDLSTNSFYPFKILGCFGDGGMITTNGEELNYKLRCLRDNGQDRAKGEILFWGWNSRLDNLQAAILLVMLRHLPEMISRRREVARLYNKGLSGIEGLSIPCDPEHSGRYFDSFQNYVVTCLPRDELVAYLGRSGVGTLISWPTPSHFHPGLRLSRFHLPRTEKFSREVVSLPMHAGLTDDEVNHVIESVRGFFRIRRAA
jgi:dTDP-4-amino-4,6-dideoxygalactose transaminase